MSFGSKGLDAIKRTLSLRGADALVAIGGDGTLGGARDLWREEIPIVGVPKTIDNDVAGTDASVGFIRRSRSQQTRSTDSTRTAESHNRVMLVEVMGRNAGWIATCAGMAGGADAYWCPSGRST